MHLKATLLLQGPVQAALFVGWRLLFQALVTDSRPGSDRVCVWGGGAVGGGRGGGGERERESFCLVRAAVPGILRAHFQT
jgi:hypothetical protein